MPKQMWFGNEQRFQWVPCPATGMQLARGGVTDSMQYDNGRTGVTRTMQTTQRFNMDFPVQEAGGLEGLDVFGKFASGFYGDLDDYPLFFADPMNYDQNLFAPNWAAPGLFERGWAPVVERPARTYLNVAQNPSVELTANDWTSVAGTGGTAAGSRFNLGTNSLNGAYTYRVLWSVATTAVSGGFTYNDAPATAGTYYGVSIGVRASKIQRVVVTMRFRNSGGTSLGTALSAQTVLAANTWSRIEVAPTIAPANTATIDVEVAAVSGTSGVTWAAGDSIHGDALVIYRNTFGNPTSYFDGDSTGAYWTGAPHASSSQMFVSQPPVTISDTAANSYNLPPRQATFNVVSTANGYPDKDATWGDIPYALIPIPTGYTLWLGASGSATGTAVVRVHAFAAPGNPSSPTNSSTLTLLSSTGATRLNASYSGATYDYVKVFIQRTSSVASTITLSAMMAQLWPTGVTPPLSTTGGSFIHGKGHRGLKFADDATVESYVMVDPTRNVPIHYKGMSTSLIEAQDKG